FSLFVAASASASCSRRAALRRAVLAFRRATSVSMISRATRADMSALVSMRVSFGTKTALTASWSISLLLCTNEKRPGAQMKKAGKFPTFSASPQWPVPVHPWSRTRGDIPSGSLKVLGGALAAAIVLHDVEAELLALDDGAHAGAFDGRDMDKHVRLAIAQFDK